MVWGYLQLTGRIEEPFVAGLKRLMTLAVVLGVALHLWLYNTLIVDTFYQRAGAARRGRRRARATRSTPSIGIWERGGAVAGYLLEQRRVFSGDFGYYVAGAGGLAVRGPAVRLRHVPASRCRSVALSVLLALGPLFIGAAVLRHHAPLLRGVARAAGQLRADHDPHRAGRGPDAAGRRVATPSRPRRAARRSRTVDAIEHGADAQCWCSCSCAR